MWLAWFFCRLVFPVAPGRVVAGSTAGARGVTPGCTATERKGRKNKIIEGRIFDELPSFADAVAAGDYYRSPTLAVPLGTRTGTMEA